MKCSELLSAHALIHDKKAIEIVVITNFITHSVLTTLQCIVLSHLTDDEIKAERGKVSDLPSL